MSNTEGKLSTSFGEVGKLHIHSTCQVNLLGHTEVQWDRYLVVYEWMNDGGNEIHWMS